VSAGLENRQDSTHSDLTHRQHEIITEVVRYKEFVGRPCPAWYVAERLAISRQRVLQHFSELHRKGWLKSSGSPAKPTE
jgi:N-acetylmuramoyl-L-alanine amidase CwlA